MQYLWSEMKTSHMRNGKLVNNSHQLLQISSFHFSALAIFDGTLVLHSHPKFVHFAKVLERELNAIGHGSTNTFEFRAFVRKLVLAHLREVTAQEQASHGVLHSTAEFDQVKQNILRRRLFGFDVNLNTKMEDGGVRVEREGVYTHTKINASVRTAATVIRRYNRGTILPEC